MVNDSALIISKRQRVAAWMVHLFTATGAVLGLVTLYAIHLGHFWLAFWFMGAAIFVDGVDGTLARKANTKVAAAKVDGALLDNILDYVNYVMVPAFFIMVSPNLLPDGWRLGASSLIVLASAYQFSQDDAKTDDHYFKGFPSYWNIVVFYLYFWELSSQINLIIMLFLVIMIFVPIKYVYPSRMDYLTKRRGLRILMLIASVMWAFSTMGLLLFHPNEIWTPPAAFAVVSPIFVIVSLGYAALYIAISLYRTFVPMTIDDDDDV
ncbi:CDP-alcohol phosphatidyltransferase family protein [Anaerolineales bacterium HSG24]|nr:CDP-alcohol phosphatidyltransferase family protein [Anaerolineales bacterium HSG24]